MIVSPGTNNILMFTLGTLLLAITPGPASIFILTKTVQQGFRAGIYSMLGIGTGSFFHLVLVIVGLASLIVNSDFTFSILKLTGISFFIFMGIRNFSYSKEYSKKSIADGGSSSRMYIEGVILNSLNPKGILFFIAFLPQFINSDKGGELSQVIILGLLFIAITVLWGLVLITAASKLRERFAKYLKDYKNQYKISGVLYIIIGLISLSIFIM